MRWALGKPPRVEVKGQGVLDIAVRENDGGTRRCSEQPHQPDDDEGADPRDLSLAAQQTVSVALPEAARRLPCRGCSLPARDAKRTRCVDGRVEIDVPGIDTLEVVHLTWGLTAEPAMLRYIIKRLIYMIPTLFGMSIIAFVIIQLPPGDYLTLRCSPRWPTAGQNVDPAQIARLTRRLRPRSAD